MQEQNEEDIEVRKKPLSFDWPIWPLSVSAFIVIQTVPPHGYISPLTAFWDRAWHARGCLKHPLRPGVSAAVAHLWQRFHGACHLDWSVLHRQNPCTGQQDRAMTWAGWESWVSSESLDHKARIFAYSGSPSLTKKSSGRLSIASGAVGQGHNMAVTYFSLEKYLKTVVA